MFCEDPIKNDPMDKISLSLNIFRPLDNNLCGSHTFEKEEVIVLEGKKIISGKILAVGLTKIDFNHR